MLADIFDVPKKHGKAWTKAKTDVPKMSLIFPKRIIAAKGWEKHGQKNC